VPDGGTAMGGGGLGSMLPFMLGGMGGCGSSSGISPLLLLLLLGGQGTCGSACSSSTTTDGGDPAASFADVLTANVGRRVRLILGTNSLVGGPEWNIIATIASVNSDYVVLDNICFNGRPEPVLSRLNLLTSQILGVHPLTRYDEFLQLSCVLSSFGSGCC
jgi:hypothetical protein